MVASGVANLKRKELNVAISFHKYPRKTLSDSIPCLYPFLVPSSALSAPQDSQSPPSHLQTLVSPFLITKMPNSNLNQPDKPPGLGPSPEVQSTKTAHWTTMNEPKPLSASHAQGHPTSTCPLTMSSVHLGARTFPVTQSLIHTQGRSGALLPEAEAKVDLVPVFMLHW